MKHKLLFFILPFLISTALPAYSDDSDISVLYINDANGNIESIMANNSENVPEESGGFARITNFVTKFKEKHTNTIFAASGDIIAPLPLSARNKGKITVELLNNAGLDVWSPGNFDFLYGFKELEKRISESKFKVISSNLFLKGTDKTWLPPYTIIEKNNKKIAFLGVTSLRYLSNFPEDVSENIEVKSPFDSVKRFSDELKGKVDVIVLIAQLNIEEKAQIMSKTNVNLIVGGIELYREAEIDNFRTVNGKVSAITRGMTRSVGEVDISLNNAKPEFYNVKENYLDGTTYPAQNLQKENEMVASLMKKYENKSSPVPLVKLDKEPSMLESQTFITGLTRYLTGSDLAIFRKAFFLRGGRFSNEITSQDVYTLLPLPFRTAIVKLSGSDLKAFLRTSNSKDFVFAGVEDNMVNGFEIDDNENYTICTDEYNYKNQSFLTERGQVDYTEKNVNDIVNDYFIKNKNKTFNVDEFDNYRLWKLKFNFDADPDILNVNIPKDNGYNYLPWRQDKSSINWGGVLGISFKRYWDKNQFDNFFDSEFRQQQTGTEPITVVADRIRFNSVFRRDLIEDRLFGFSELRVSTLFTNPNPDESPLLLGQLIAGIGQNTFFDIRVKEGLEVRKNFLDASLPWEAGPHLSVQLNRDIFFLNEVLDARFFIPFSFNRFITEIENRVSLPITDRFSIFYKLNLYNESKDFTNWAIRNNVGVNFSFDKAVLF